MNDFVDLDDIDSKIFRISWENINHGAEAIAKNISNNHKPEAIVCKQFDVIPAAIVARHLKLPLCIVHPETRYNGIIVDCIPSFSKPIRSGEYYQPKPKIAFVTTMIDDEENLNDLVGYYKDNRPIVMSIYSRKNTKNVPTYNWTLIANAVNCIYPWEEK